MPAADPRLLFVVTEDWYFRSHRLALARAARSAGYRVAVATRVGALGDEIERAGIEVLPLSGLRRSAIGPVALASSIVELARLYRRWAPDLVHHVALKPILCGAAAAHLAGCRRVINAVAGFGFVFSSDRPRARLLRPAVATALKWSLDRPGSTVLVQNAADAEAVRRLAPTSDVVLIRGSGVDTDRFRPADSPVDARAPIVMLAARMLWDKGIGEFVATARQVKAQRPSARFVLVGGTDDENPGVIPSEQLHQWQAAGEIEWWGHADDMASVWPQAAIACLPSYAEGLPKVLLEAAACGLPLIGSNIAGCREVVREDITGLLVPPRDSGALAAAVVTLLDDLARRRRLGAAARRLVEAEFSEHLIIEQMLALYRRRLETP